jgi:hypothetical protein
MIQRPIPFLCGVIATGALFSASSARSAVITGVSIDSVSSELVVPGGFERAAVNILGVAGFDELTGFHTNVPDSSGGAGPAPATMWLTNGVFSAPNDPLPAFVTLDLGGSYNLDSLKVWNYNEAFAAPTLVLRGANSVDISVASTVGGPFTSLGNFAFAVAPGTTATDFGQVIDLSSFPAADNARLVRLDILSNHGGDNSFAGLSKLRFDGTVVPEPAALGFIGLALTGFVLRRRK